MNEERRQRDFDRNVKTILEETETLFNFHLKANKRFEELWLSYVTGIKSFDEFFRMEIEKLQSTFLDLPNEYVSYIDLFTNVVDENGRPYFDTLDSLKQDIKKLLETTFKGVLWQLDPLPQGYSYLKAVDNHRSSVLTPISLETLVKVAADCSHFNGLYESLRGSEPDALNQVVVSRGATASFAAILHQSGIRRQGDEHNKSFVMKICTEFNLFHSDRVRQEYTPAMTVTTNHAKEIVQSILPRLDKSVSTKILEHLKANGYQTE